MPPPARRGTQFAVIWDYAAMRRADLRLGEYMMPALARRMDLALTKELKHLLTRMRSAAKSSGIQPKTGEHFRKISRRKNRKRPGEIVAQTVGPNDHKRHLLIQGHRIVTPGGRDLGRRSRAFPYVNDLVDNEPREIWGNVGREIWQLR